MTGYVYRLDFASGKSYVGITRRTPRKRFNAHAASARNGATAAVYNAWRKHGAPQLVVLAIVEDADLEATEVRAIAIYGTLWPHGYNLTTGGEMVRHSQESRRRMSVARSGRTTVPCSEEKKRLISLANKGSKRTPEQRLKMSLARKAAGGRPCSPETRAKLSLVKTGKSKPQPPCSEATRLKISLAQKGKVIPAEVREKISAALLGRPVPALQGRSLSPEHRQKLKDAWVIRRARGAA